MTRTTRETVRETASVIEAEVIDGSPDLLNIGIITAGQGSSGYYSPEVLEAAAADKVFPKGTHMYFDHPTESEKYEKPERSVLKLGAVLQEDATWDATRQRLQAPAAPVAAYRELLTDRVFLEAVGVSIVASAEVSEGDVDGQRTTIIDRLVQGQSVDFVTHAGRGGSVLLESARPTMVLESAMARGVSEATVNDKREALSTLVRDAYSDDKVWVWLRDFDDTTAWFDVENGDGSGTYAQTYSNGEDDLPAELTGDRYEVRVATQYVPVNPAGPIPTEESLKEDTMATTQIEESELSTLRETAGRVSALENERDTERARANAAEAQLAERDRGDAADKVIESVAEAAEVEFDELQVAGLKAVLPLKEGALDAEAFTKTVEKAAEKLAERGQIRGFGATSTKSGEVTEADYDAVFGKEA